MAVNYQDKIVEHSDEGHGHENENEKKLTVSDMLVPPQAAVLYSVKSVEMPLAFAVLTALCSQVIYSRTMRM